MKILILSTKTGQGHNSAALALKESFENSYKTDCTVVDVLNFWSIKAPNITGNVYENIVVKTPALFGEIYKAGDFVSRMDFNSPIYYVNAIYAKKLYEYIVHNGFDACVTTHLFAMEALTYIKRNFDSSLKCYGIFTDYTLSPFIRETDMNMFFVPHKDIIEECVSQGMDVNKLKPTGIPVLSKFRNHPSKGEARNILKIEENKKVYLLMSGGMGAGNLVEICHQILRHNDRNTLLYVICGRNTKLKGTIDSVFRKTKRIITKGFTDEIPLYMSACDVLLTKPGGLSSTEAAALNVPIVHTQAIPGCETKNAEFFSGKLMSLKSDSPEDSATLAKLLYDNENLRNSMISAQKENINSHAADDICEYIVKDCLDAVSV